MLWIPDLRSWIPDSLSVELDYSRFQSLAVFRNPRTQDSRFHKQTFPGFQIVQPNFRGISEDRLGFWIPGPGFRIPSQWNLDSGSQSLAVFRIPKAQDSRFHEQTFLGFQILQPNLREISEGSLGFWIPGPGFRISSQWNLYSRSQSLAGFWIPRPQDSDFVSKHFPDCQILHAKISRIPQSRLSYMGQAIAFTIVNPDSLAQFSEHH